MQGGTLQVKRDISSPCKIFFLVRLSAVIISLREDGIEPDVLISNLEYIGEVLGVLAAKDG